MLRRSRLTAGLTLALTPLLLAWGSASPHHQASPTIPGAGPGHGALETTLASGAWSVGGELGLSATLPPLSPIESQTDPRIDRERLLEHLSILAHDSMEGRRTGSPGNERARNYLIRVLDELGLPEVDGAREHPFQFTNNRDGRDYTGVNLMGVVQGTVAPDTYLVVTAHYDHLGEVDGEIFNGADDNGSGTAALLELARYFLAHPPDHSILFVFFDAEEMGLQGARAFVQDPPVPLGQFLMNINLDMVSRNEDDELYAAGTYHYPFLTPLVDEVAEGAQLHLLRGHDSPDLPPGDDWTMASDHGPFHERGVPFIYFGVEDHPGYHHPSDTFENITPDFYHRAVETILDFILVADREGQGLSRHR